MSSHCLRRTHARLVVRGIFKLRCFCAGHLSATGCAAKKKCTYTHRRMGFFYGVCVVSCCILLHCIRMYGVRQCEGILACYGNLRSGNNTVVDSSIYVSV